MEFQLGDILDVVDLEVIFCHFGNKKCQFHLQPGYLILPPQKNLKKRNNTITKLVTFKNSHANVRISYAFNHILSFIAEHFFRDLFINFLVRFNWVLAQKRVTN